MKPSGVSPSKPTRSWPIQAGKTAAKKAKKAPPGPAAPAVDAKPPQASGHGPAVKPPAKATGRLTETDKQAHAARVMTRVQTVLHDAQAYCKVLTAAVSNYSKLQGSAAAVEKELKKLDDLKIRLREDARALSAIASTPEHRRALGQIDDQIVAIALVSQDATLGLMEIQRLQRHTDETQTQVVLADGAALLNRTSADTDGTDATMLSLYRLQMQATQAEINRLSGERDSAVAVLDRTKKLAELNTEVRLEVGRAQLKLTGVTPGEGKKDTFSLDEQLAELQRMQLALMVTASAMENRRPPLQARDLDEALRLYGLSVTDDNVCLALNKLQSLYELPFLETGRHGELLIFSVRGDGSVDKSDPIVLRESSGEPARARVLERVIPALYGMGVARLMATATMLHAHFGVTPKGVRFDAAGQPMLARSPEAARATLAKDLATNEALLAQLVGIDALDHLSRAAIARLLLGQPESKHRSHIEDAFMALARRRRVITSDGLWTLQTRFSRQTTREGLAQILANPKEPHEARDAAWALLHNAELRKACNLDPSGVLTVDNLDALAKRIDKLERASGDFKDGVPLHTANDEPLFRAATIGHAIELETLLNSGDGNALKILHWLEKLPPRERKMIVLELSAKGGGDYLSELLSSRLSPQYAAMLDEFFKLDTSLAEQEAWAAKAIKKPRALVADLEALYEEWLYAHQQNRLGQPVPVANDMRQLYDSLRRPFMPGGAFDELCQLADKASLTAAEAARRAELEKLLVPLLARAKLYAPLLHTMTDVAIDGHRAKIRRWSDIAATVAVGALSTAFALRVLVAAAEWATASWLRTGMMVAHSVGGGTAAGFDAALVLSASRQLASEGRIDIKQLTDDGLKGLSVAFMSSVGVVMSTGAVAGRALSTLGSYSRIAAANVAALPITRTFDAGIGAAFTDQTFADGWRAGELGNDALRTIVSTTVFGAVSKAFPTRGLWNALVSGGIGAAEGVLYNRIRGRDLSEGVAEGVMSGFISSIAFDQAHRMRLLEQAKSLRAKRVERPEAPSEPIDFHEALAFAAHAGDADLSVRAADLYLTDSIRHARAAGGDPGQTIEQLRRTIALVDEHVPAGSARATIENKLREAQVLLNSLEPTPEMVAQLKRIDAIVERGKSFVPLKELALWRELERARVLYPGEPNAMDVATLALPELKPIFADMLNHMVGKLRTYKGKPQARRSAEALLARVENALVSDALSLADVTRMSRAFSVLMQKLRPLNFSVRRVLKGNANLLKKTIETELRAPNTQMLPTHNTLDEWHFVRLRNLLTVFPLGITDRRVIADMLNMWPIAHVEHDLAHADAMKKMGPSLDDMTHDERLDAIEQSLHQAKILFDAMDQVRVRFDDRAWHEAKAKLFYQTHEDGGVLDTHALKDASRLLKIESTGIKERILKRGHNKAGAALLDEALKIAEAQLVAEESARAQSTVASRPPVTHASRQPPTLTDAERIQGLTQIAEYHVATASLGYARSKLLNSEHTPAAFRHRLTEHIRPSDVEGSEISRLADTPARVLELLVPRALKTPNLARNIADHPRVSERMIADMLASKDGRWGVAGGRQTDPKVLAHLAADPDPHIRVQVAANPKTPPDVLRTLAKEHPEHVARNSSAPPDALEALATHKDRVVRRAVAQNRATPAHTLQQLAHGDPALMPDVLANPSASPDLLATLGQRSTELRGYAAENPSTRPEQLREWANDPSPEVRLQVANNASCPLDAVRALLHDRDARVVRQAIANEKLPLVEARAAATRLGFDSAGESWSERKDLEASDLRQLAKAQNPSDARVARHRLATLSTDPQELRALVRSHDPRVKYAALRNPAMPDDVLISLFNTAADRVRRQVASWQDKLLLAVLNDLAQARLQGRPPR